MSTDVTPDVTATQRKVLAVLAASQVFGGVGFSTAIAVSALTASRLSGSEAVGGAAQTTAVIGAAIAALVTARVAARAGRRPALTFAYGTSAAGGAAAVLAVAVGSAAALLAALLFVGAATAAGLAARFGATDLAAPSRRAKALSLVVWATTVGAVAGPNLAGPVQNLAGGLGWEPSTGPFVLCTAAFAVAAAISWLGLRPDPLRLARSRASGDPSARPAMSGAQVRAVLRASPPAVLGLAGVALGHLVMVAVMSMTPVHMDHAGASLQIIGLVISLHVVGMYAFSPVFGWLADRFGRRPVLVLGAGMLATSGVLAAAADDDHLWLTVALVLLGLGWSAGLIAGSTLLTDSVPVDARPGAQGLSDVTMNVAGAIGGIAGGVTVAATSFAVLGVAAAVLVVPYAVAITAVLRPARAG